MTTVGYGDKCPASFGARLFTFFWLLVGLVIIGILTGDVTTALTTLSMQTDTDIFGKDVVVFNKSEESRYAAESNAIPMPVTNITDFVAAIKNGDVAGGLIDAYVAGYESGNLSRQNGVKVGDIIDVQFTYGVVLSNSLNNPYIPKCFSRQLSADESWIVEKITRTMTALPDNQTSDNTADMFDASSSMYQSAIFACLLLSFFFIACALAWEYFYWKPKVQRESDTSDVVDRVDVTSNLSYDDLVLNQCNDMDCAMTSEVRGFYDSLRDKMMEIRDLHFHNDPERCKDVDVKKMVMLDCHSDVTK